MLKLSWVRPHKISIQEAVTSVQEVVVRLWVEYVALSLLNLRLFDELFDDECHVAKWYG